MGCVDHPEQLSEACEAFATSDFATGLQTGSLSPILNALRPDDFAIVSNKTHKVLKELGLTFAMAALLGTKILSVDVHHHPRSIAGSMIWMRAILLQSFLAVFTCPSPVV